MRKLLLASLSCVSTLAFGAAHVQHQSKPSPHKTAPAVTAGPIMFAGQVPWTGAFTIASTFGNQRSEINRVPRGGDLFIQYPDGVRRNMTREAGFGCADAFQGTCAIAVRNPSVSYDGTKAVFAMVIGAPARQYQQVTVFWQLYEVTGLGEGDTASITKVASQPTNVNNTNPTYAPDGGILFASEWVRAPWLYPRLDEYESQPTNTGLFKLSPGPVVTLAQFVDAPSGIFDPMVTSDGRIMFAQWDHQQRDQQCDGSDATTHGCGDHESEAQNSPLTGTVVDLIPENRTQTEGNVLPHTFNEFAWWTLNQDGTSHETVNHFGPHESQSYFGKSFNDDPNLRDFEGIVAKPIGNMLMPAEDPTTPALFYGIDAPEFDTDSAGQLISLSAPIHVPADTLAVAYVSPRGNNDRFRNPAVLSTGQLVASYAGQHAETDTNVGQNPMHTLYDFRLRTVNGGVAAGYVTSAAGITRSVNWWSPDEQFSYNGPLWELYPVEVRARPIPPMTTTAIEAPELLAFADAGVAPAQFTAWLAQKDLAAIVIRDVTSRDDADHQQPFNLSAPGGHTTVGAGGKIYPITCLQLFQADALREVTNFSTGTGRRDLGREMHDAQAFNPPAPGCPAGSTLIGADGSIAVLVPAARAITFHTTGADGKPVVRERSWLTFRSGEVRVCSDCHGVNTLNQAGHPSAQNKPTMLTTLLNYWRSHFAPLPDVIFANGFEQAQVKQ